MSFTKILIANRGEIACRIARTAHAMGYRTVAAFSDADADALHTRVCDEAIRIGPAEARLSYLSIDAIIAAARRTGADAIHPGYGFLSENPAFAEACHQAEIVLIGPPAKAIAAMGNKAAAKRLMIEAGVPCVPGYQGADQSPETLALEAKRIGFPIMVKASAGGGGRGMRIVATPQNFVEDLVQARSEAMNAFGSDEVILEKAIVDARHVEIQVFADAHGNVIHLGERDCSVQRRHQKVIEEAPSPAVDGTIREGMGAAAVAAARAIGYRGAGTVEFLLSANGAFYFLEMNTRLQVEHPVTEMITGLDLVEWQLRVAAGEPLPLSQADVSLSGHAIEARLYAEAPEQGFLPQSGPILVWKPAHGAGVRVDHGLCAPGEITSHYDPMIAKVIAYGATREEARRRLVRALEQTQIFGIATNRAFLMRVFQHEEFVAGRATTSFIGTHYPAGSAAAVSDEPPVALTALAAVLLTTTDFGGSISTTWAWSSTGPRAARVSVERAGATGKFEIVARSDGSYEVNGPGGRTAVVIFGIADGIVRYEIDGLRRAAQFHRAGDALHLASEGRTFLFEDATRRPSAASGAAGAHRLLAPMNGKIVAVLASVGESVRKGQRIAVLEAMKMQHELLAERDGNLAEVAVSVGDQVATRQLIAALAND